MLFVESVAAFIKGIHLFSTLLFVVIVLLYAVYHSALDGILAVILKQRTLNRTCPRMAWRICLQIFAQFSLNGCQFDAPRQFYKSDIMSVPWLKIQTAATGKIRMQV